MQVPIVELSGKLFDYFICYWAGVLVSFTPCLYPVIPLTASFIAGINTRGTKLMGFVLSLLYVLGVSITYCTLAVLAGVTGQFFGQVQSSPFVILFIAVVLGFFALMMFDVVKVPMLGFNIQNKIKTKNVFTIILFGIAAGLIIGPCTAPILGSLLLYISSKQDILRSVSLMFVFSFGIGTSLIIVGTFSGVLSSLPKSGKWMVRVKQFCGIVLSLASLYFFIQACIRIF